MTNPKPNPWRCVHCFLMLKTRMCDKAIPYLPYCECKGFDTCTRPEKGERDHDA